MVELHTFIYNDKIISIHSEDTELFRNCREIWIKITESIGINNARDFVETTLSDGDGFIMVDVHRNTSSVRDNYRNKLIIVLHSVIYDCLQTWLVQNRYQYK